MLGIAIQVIRNCFTPPVHRIVHSVPERSCHPEIKKHVLEMRTLRQAAAVSYSFSEERPACFRRDHAFERKWLYRIRNARVYMPTGFTRLETLWLQESIGHLRSVMMFKPEYRFVSAAPDATPYATVVNPTGYYHFLMESVPNLLYSARCFPQVNPLVYAPERFSFIKAFLGYLVEARKISGWRADHRKAVQFEDLILPQVEEKSGFVHPADIALLRDAFLPFGETGQRGPKRFFVSRKNVRRSLANQELVEDMLKGFGVATVYSEELTLADQIRLFRDAELVVANHGAGLSNLVWGGQGARVVEIFSPTFFNDCFARLAVGMGMAYEPVFADPSGTWGAVNLEELRAKI